MRASLTKQEWDSWKEQELKNIKNLLTKLEIVLDVEQPHISGERYLMSGKKLVLQGQHLPTKKKIIIKYSNDKDISKDIKDERTRKKTIESVNFGYKSIYFPVEFLFDENKDYTILVTEFIPQYTVFVKMPLEKQFFLSLKALEAFEGVHSVVTSHDRDLINLNTPFSAKRYLEEFEKMFTETEKLLGEQHETVSTLSRAKKFLQLNENLLEKYCDFLTHDDFVPHNMRVQGNDVVVLDHSSLILGNKYESWARFLNFMILFGQELEHLLSNFVKENRGEEEHTVLRLMRIYKISFLLNFYAKAIKKTEGNLLKITDNRLQMWTKILDCLLNNREIPKELIAEHHKILEENRSEEEKKRHKEISG